MEEPYNGSYLLIGGLGQMANVSLPSSDPPALDVEVCEYFLGDESTHRLVVFLCVYGLIGPSLAFAVLAVALTKARRRRWACGGGRRGWGGCEGPGTPEPLGLGAVVEKDRLGSVLGFAAAALVTTQVVLGQGAFGWRDEAPVWASSLASLALGLAVGQMYWPVLVGLSHDHALVSLAATAYSAGLTAVLVFANLPCRNAITDAPTLHVLVLALKWLPIFLLQLFVTLWIPFRRFSAVWAAPNDDKITKRPTPGTEVYQFAHVRQLMNAKSTLGKAHKELVDSIVEGSWRYRNLPGFRFSAVFLSAMWMGLFFVIFMTAEFIQAWLQLSAYLEASFAFAFHPLTTPPTALGYAMVALVQSGALPEEFLTELYRWVSALETTLLVAMLSTTLLVTLSLLLMLRNYRRHTLLAYRGRVGLAREWTAVAVAGNAVRYLGVQYGYVVWAFLLQFSFLFLVFGVLTALGILVFHYEMYSIVENAAERAGPVFVYVALLWLVQRLCLRRWLLARDGRDESVLGLRNRRAFSNYAYFMAFGSAPLGLFSCAQRVLRATLSGLWLLPRLDVPVLSEAFQRFDPGFPHYASLLRLETTQRNPCLVVFLHHLFQDSHYRLCPLHKASEVRPLEDRLDNIQKHRRLRFKLVRNRWALLLTLHWNPALRLYRKHRLRSSISESL